MGIMVFLSVVILVMSNFTLREMRYKRNVKKSKHIMNTRYV